ncbi:MAG: rod shape-determining protein, partial [Desulfovibrionaceae bacterium]|nr:rod shape-determining protein [Desulfovibrionaceae bacterium]
MILQRLLRFLSKDIAMDLGTANTLLYTRKHGIFINEPSVVALDARNNSVLAVGAAAKEFIGRTPQRIKAIRPMKDGVIADFDVTQAMISYFVRKIITGLRLVRPSMVICIPTGITQVEKKAVIDAALLAGASSVLLVEEPMAAAIGADLPIHEPLGNMVLDIGGGTSEVAVITLGGVASAESVRVAGDAMNMAVARYLRDVFRMEVGENTAENVKILLGSAVPQPNAPALDVSGKDLLTGHPKVVTVTEGHIRE